VTRPTSTRRSSLGRGGALLAAAGLVSLALGACTMSADEPDEPAGDGAPATGAAGAPEPDDEPSPEGVDPAELNDQVLAAAEGSAEPLGSVTGNVPPQNVQTVLDVLEVRPVDGATLVRMRLSTTGDTLLPTQETFSGVLLGTQWFVRDVYLDDTSGGTRYLPLQFTDYRDACICPYKAVQLGPEPQVVDALFPALPEGATTVDLSIAGTELVLAGLPVG